MINSIHKIVKTPKKIILILFLFGSIVLISANNIDGLLFTGDFEKGDLAGFGTETCLNCDKAIQIVTAPVRSGKYAARFQLGINDLETKANGTGSYRSEIKLPKEPGGESVERWYAFSIFLPQDFAIDPANEVVAQWHGSPDVDEGEGKKASPPMALRVINGQWLITWRWDSRRVTIPIEKPEGNSEKLIGKYKVNEWTDWVFHVKRSYKQDGFFEVWQNGKKVLENHGPNTYNDKLGAYFKTGIYKPKWAEATRHESTTTGRVLYIDEVRVGDEKANLKMMSPPTTNR